MISPQPETPVEDTNISSPLSTISDNKTDILSQSDNDHKGCNTPETNLSVMDESDVPPLKRHYELLDIQPDHVENGIPVFKPTWDEFKDFYIFQKSINKFGMESGIVKVIPPAEWLENEMPKRYSEEIISNIQFKSPITQEFTNHLNCYSINNIEKKKTFNLLQWKKLSYQQNYLIPPMKGEKDPLYNKPTKSDLKKFSDVRGNTNVVSEGAFKDFDYNIDTSIYTKDRCEYLENQYWKTISFSTPLYGADSLGSLFTDDQKVWNVAKLPNLLDWLPERVPGVNDAYLYGGLWKASFSWHLEDQDLYSINYLHFGAPKQWYSIPQKDHIKFYKLMADIFPDDYANCSEFLRHKTFLASPSFLRKHGIQVNKVTHFEKEFIITYPFGYHSGFNYGYNQAESVNFALDNWLDIGLASKRCMCVDDSVGINVEKLIHILNGEEYQSEDEMIISEEELEEPEKVAGVTIHKQKPVPTRTKHQQCILCPHRFSKKYTGSYLFELLDIIDCEKFSRGVKYNRFWKCHRICAELIAELSIVKKSEALKVPSESIEPSSIDPNGSDAQQQSNDVPAVPSVPTVTDEIKDDDSKREVVIGYQDIPKARKNLKCLACSGMIFDDLQFKDVCFQCSYGKCTRAYHATCSISAGVQLSKDENGVVSGLCRFHRPSKYPLDYINEYHESLSVDDFVQFKFSNDYYAGHIISNNSSEGSVTVLVFDVGLSVSEMMEVPYELLLVPPENGDKISLKDLPNNIDLQELERRKLREQKEQLKQQMKEERLLQQAERREEKRLEKLKRQVSEVNKANQFELGSVVTETDKYSNYTVPMGVVYNNNDSFNYVETIKPELVEETKADVTDVWDYMPECSTDQVARYRNDRRLTTPNDPGYHKFLRKQELEKERLVRRELRKKRKLELSAHAGSAVKPQIAGPSMFTNQNLNYQNPMVTFPDNQSSFTFAPTINNLHDRYQQLASANGYNHANMGNSSNNGPVQFLYVSADGSAPRQ